MNSDRVIAKEHLPFLPIFKRIDESIGCNKLTIAIEGGSASGKTTLSNLLSNTYDCTVFHMDDFFLQAIFEAFGFFHHQLQQYLQVLCIRLLLQFQ